MQKKPKKEKKEKADKKQTIKNIIKSKKIKIIQKRKQNENKNEK